MYLTSRQKSCLTAVELEYLASLPRVRDMSVQNFMMTPMWFRENNKGDVVEIARFVMKQTDAEIRKRNWRLYKFATGRSPKSDARLGKTIF